MNGSVGEGEIEVGAVLGRGKMDRGGRGRGLSLTEEGCGRVGGERGAVRGE